MKKLLMLILVACVLGPLVVGLGGCSTLTMDPADHTRSYGRIFDLECRQVAEDWDYLWLYDEPSKLTPFYMPDRE